MTEDWRNCIDNKEAFAAVAADLSKTFDAINHRLSDVSLTILEFSINKDLQTLSSWFDSNQLTVNSTTTKALSVGPCDYIYS